MPEIEIVHYKKSYREMVRDCVYETGYGGESVAPFFEDRKLFADFLTLYYTDFEPESAFVPLVDGEPAGYLLGCVDTKRSEAIQKKVIMPRIIVKLLTGKYKQIGPVTRRYILRFLLQGIRKEEIRAPADEYPAHLHIDLYKPYRRVGLGGRLIAHYIEFLKSKGCPGLHLVTSSFHTEALPFYEKLGFRRHSEVRLTTSYFKEVSNKPLKDICFVKKLD